MSINVTAWKRAYGGHCALHRWRCVSNAGWDSDFALPYGRKQFIFIPRYLCWTDLLSVYSYWFCLLKEKKEIRWKDWWSLYVVGNTGENYGPSHFNYNGCQGTCDWSLGWPILFYVMTCSEKQIAMWVPHHRFTTSEYGEHQIYSNSVVDSNRGLLNLVEQAPVSSFEAVRH